MIDQEKFKKLAILSRLDPKKSSVFNQDFNEILSYIEQMLSLYDKISGDEKRQQNISDSNERGRGNTRKSKKQSKKSTNKRVKNTHKQIIAKELSATYWREDKGESSLDASQLADLAKLAGDHQEDRWQAQHFVVPGVIDPE